MKKRKDEKMIKMKKSFCAGSVCPRFFYVSVLWLFFLIFIYDSDTRSDCFFV